MVLEEVKSYVLGNLKNEDTEALLLVGSWARGTGNDPFDIDVFHIKKYQLIESYNSKLEKENYYLDIWIHDFDSLNDVLSTAPVDLNDLNKLSLTILGMKDAVVWFDKSNSIETQISLAKNYNWSNIDLGMFDINIDRFITSRI